MRQADGVRVLVAEDDELLADTVDDFLRQEGFHVSLARDGRAALETAETTCFDALVTDLRMPRLDGTRLIRLLRAARPGLPVVVMSGNAPPDWQTALQRAGEGPLRLLNKPMRLRDLLAALREVLAETHPGPC